jgi:hypothetical protein
MSPIISNDCQSMKFTLHKSNKDRFSIYPKIIICHIILALVILPGIVLCIGADGHYALENASDNFKCDNIAESPHDVTSQFSQSTRMYSDRGHCGPCTDIAISVDRSDKSILKAQGFSSEMKGKVFSRLLSTLPVFVEISTGAHLPQKPSTVISKITSLQNVILLC